MTVTSGTSHRILAELTTLTGLVGREGTDECIGPSGNGTGNRNGTHPMMRVTTLKASADRVGTHVDYYAGLAEDRGRPDRRSKGPADYYLDPDEPAGRWWGAGRRALGIDGAVAGEGLRVLLQARHPVTGQKLGRGFGDTSARGFDATFSAPKSVSALWALTPDPWIRAEVLAAHDSAVDAALGWFEQHGSVTRRGTNGIHQVDTQGVTAALFRQHTSRTVDPQLHTHAIISSKVQDLTGTWFALDARFLKYQQRTIGWIYDAALRTELTARLGVSWEPTDGGQADLACVPEAIRDTLSKRSVQVQAKLAELIERWSDEHDGADPEVLTIADLERQAVTSSRPSKTHPTGRGSPGRRCRRDGLLRSTRPRRRPRRDRKDPRHRPCGHNAPEPRPPGGRPRSLGQGVRRARAGGRVPDADPRRVRHPPPEPTLVSLAEGDDVDPR